MLLIPGRNLKFDCRHVFFSGFIFRGLSGVLGGWEHFSRSYLTNKKISICPYHSKNSWPSTGNHSKWSCSGIPRYNVEPSLISQDSTWFNPQQKSFNTLVQRSNFMLRLKNPLSLLHLFSRCCRPSRILLFSSITRGGPTISVLLVPRLLKQDQHFDGQCLDGGWPYCKW